MDTLTQKLTVLIAVLELLVALLRLIDFIFNVPFNRDVNIYGGLLAKNIWKVDRRK